MKIPMFRTTGTNRSISGTIDSVVHDGGISPLNANQPTS